MSATLTAVARGAAALIPLTLLALGLVFVASIAVVWPSADRRDMVDRLAAAMGSLGAVIAGSANRSAVKAGTGLPGHR
jgi:hypothetical protein